jgi:hypothetical protein
MIQTFAVVTVLGAKLVSVTLAVDGVSFSARTGAKVLSERIAVEGTTRMLFETATVGAKVVRLRARVDRTKPNASIGENVEMLSDAVSGMTVTFVGVTIVGA